ncbi:MAG: hypothetical protein J6A26_06175 [Oscillospiraceae bacterium]|nr:hypothetical protein [Oscillospiraceae bacterium]
MKWQSSNHYSREDLSAMQKDAMERVREMQRRADENLRRSNAALPPQSQQEDLPPPQPETPAAQAAAPPPAPVAPPPPSGNRLSQILSVVGVDQDRAIILGLLLILYNDRADPLLLLALLYLLL